LSAQIKSISFAGAGNVATHLARAFNNEGYPVTGIYSPGMASATVLASEVGAKVCTSIKELDQLADLIIISVPDHAFSEVLEALCPTQKIIIHTSGGLDLAGMREKAAKCGVIYPLQTFSKNTVVNIKEVPFCIEASDKELLEELHTLASSVSDVVLEIDSEKRRVLHLSAVFAGNFSNNMYAVAAEILKSAELSFQLLHPLILETARKATLQAPLEAQTGPARRKDHVTMEAHETMLEKSDLYRQIYELLSKSIQENYGKEDV